MPAIGTPAIISHAVWLYFRFPLGLRMVEELLAARGIIVSHETVRQWARRFGQPFANRIRRRLPRIGDKWAAKRLLRKLLRKQLLYIGRVASLG
jgi:transposase-like protein